MGGKFTDRTAAVRTGETLDLLRLTPYLRELTGQPDAAVRVRQFPGGYSNLTYAVTVGETELVLRRPPFGSSVKTAHDMGREFAVLSKLAPICSWAPKPLGLCEDETILGAKFYVMQRLRGIILRRDVPDGLTVDAPLARRMCESFVDTLAQLHTLDYVAAGLGDFGKPDGYVMRQVIGWTKRYVAAQTDEIDDVNAVADWLGSNMPDDGSSGVVHNDYKWDNLVLRADQLAKIVGILDWEMATVGDPLMDLGTSLCYWVEESDPGLMKEMRFGPTVIPGMFTRRELCERYFEQTRRTPVNMTYYYCFGLFKTAVVAQQIYARFKMGMTKDQRFGRFIVAVRALAQQAMGVLASGRV